MIAGATMDDSDDLVSVSSKKDNQVLRDVENTIVSFKTCMFGYLYVNG